MGADPTEVNMFVLAGIIAIVTIVLFLELGRQADMRLEALRDGVERQRQEDEKQAAKGETRRAYWQKREEETRIMAVFAALNQHQPPVVKMSDTTTVEAVFEPKESEYEPKPLFKDSLWTPAPEQVKS